MSDEMICLSKLYIRKSEIIAIEFDLVLGPKCDNAFTTVISTKNSFFSLTTQDLDYKEDVQKIKAVWLNQGIEKEKIEV